MSSKPGARRYTRIAVDAFDQPLHAGASVEATLLYARLRTSGLKRTIPGLLSLGQASVAERFGLTMARARRALGELEAKRYALIDANNHLMYMRGAIEDDPPRTVQAVKAFAAQAKELPSGAIALEVLRAVTAVLADTSEYPTLSQEWHRAFPNVQSILSEAFSEAHSETVREALTEPSTVTVTVTATRLPGPADLDPRRAAALQAHAGADAGVPTGVDLSITAAGSIAEPLNAVGVVPRVKAS